MKKVLKNAVRWISNIFLVLVVFVTVILVITKIAGERPTLFGFNFYYIATGSMEPELKIGDVILSREADIDGLEKGDIITFLGKEGELEGKTVTHRIENIYEENGSRVFVTKGDANTVTDKPVHENEVMSEMAFKVPLLGSVIKVINTPIGFIFLIVAPLLLNLGRELHELFKILKADCKEQNDERKD